MTFLNIHPIKTTCAVIAGAVGGWTLAGVATVLSILASIVAMVVGCMQAYDWIQRKRKGK